MVFKILQKWLVKKSTFVWIKKNHLEHKFYLSNVWTLTPYKNISKHKAKKKK